MSFKVIFVLIIVFDIILSINICKKDISSFKQKLPYPAPTYVLLFLAPSIMRNYYIINSCNEEQSLKICLVCSCVLGLFHNERVSQKIKDLFWLISFNIVYVYIVSQKLYSSIEGNDLFKTSFNVLTIMCIFLIYISIIDILARNIVYGILSNGKVYNTVITVTLYVLTIYFATNVSAFRYYDNLLELLSPTITTNGTPTDDKLEGPMINNYTPIKESIQGINMVENSLSSLNDDISHSLKHDYKDYIVGNGVVWLVNSRDYQDIEILNYLETICASDNYNPFRLTRQIFETSLDTEVSPQKFSNSVIFENTNSLNIDYSQIQDVDSYIKIVYRQIMSKFCSKNIESTQVNIGEEGTQKYIFTVYFNEVTQTYDVFCLYFQFDNGTFDSIHYDIVTISKNPPTEIYSNYVDILPINQTKHAKEKYESYSVNDEYYVTFKYYEKPKND